MINQLEISPPIGNRSQFVRAGLALTALTAVMVSGITLTNLHKAASQEEDQQQQRGNTLDEPGVGMPARAVLVLHPFDALSSTKRQAQRDLVASTVDSYINDRRALFDTLPEGGEYGCFRVTDVTPLTQTRTELVINDKPVGVIPVIEYVAETERARRLVGGVERIGAPLRAYNSKGVVNPDACGGGTMPYPVARDTAQQQLDAMQADVRTAIRGSSFPYAYKRVTFSSNVLGL